MTEAFVKRTTLNGLNSHDPGNNNLTYLWQQTSGPAVTLNNYQTANPNFIAPSGSHTLIFQLITSNDSDTSLPDTVTLTVIKTPSDEDENSNTDNSPNNGNNSSNGNDSNNGDTPNGNNNSNEDDSENDNGSSNEGNEQADELANRGVTLVMSGS